MFKLLSSITFAIALFSDIVTSESSFTLTQSWSKLDLPMSGNLIRPVTPVSSHYHKIRVVGRLNKDDVFNVDLISGDDPSLDDIPLHLRIDPGNQKLMTSKSIWTSGTNKPWGPDVYTGLTLAAGAKFEIEIIVKHTHFVIFVNDRLIQKHLHYLPPSASSYVHIYCHDKNIVFLESVSREYPVYAPTQL